MQMSEVRTAMSTSDNTEHDLPGCEAHFYAVVKTTSCGGKTGKSSSSWMSSRSHEDLVR